MKRDSCKMHDIKPSQPERLTFCDMPFNAQKNHVVLMAAVNGDTSYARMPYCVMAPAQRGLMFAPLLHSTSLTRLS